MNTKRIDWLVAILVFLICVIGMAVVVAIPLDNP